MSKQGGLSYQMMKTLQAIFRPGGSRHEDHDRPLALQACIGNFNKLAVVESLGLERLNLGVDKRHRFLLAWVK